MTENEKMEVRMALAEEKLENLEISNEAVWKLARDIDKRFLIILGAGITANIFLVPVIVAWLVGKFVHP